MNPWGAKTLEWTVPNPIPLENFPVLPVVTEDAYGYGAPKPVTIPEQPGPVEVPVGVQGATAAELKEGNPR
jgi:cytochrome c oxidase subunit 1